MSHYMVYVMFSNLSPTNLTPMVGATKSSCTPMFTFFMELLRRRRGKMESDDEKGDCG